MRRIVRRHSSINGSPPGNVQTKLMMKLWKYWRIWLSAFRVIRMSMILTRNGGCKRTTLHLSTYFAYTLTMRRRWEGSILRILVCPPQLIWRCSRRKRRIAWDHSLSPKSLSIVATELTNWVTKWNRESRRSTMARSTPLPERNIVMLFLLEGQIRLEIVIIMARFTLCRMIRVSATRLRNSKKLTAIVIPR